MDQDDLPTLNTADNADGATRQLPPVSLAGASAPVTCIGRYQVVAELGCGGMGVVYKALDPTLSRHVAIKLMTISSGGNPNALDRFAREARVAARLRHPGIVSVHEVGDHQGEPFIVMDYVEGLSLRELQSDGPLPSRKAARLVRQVALAVDHAHSLGVLHRDIKPANVLVDGDGHALLADFGLARDVQTDSAPTQTGSSLGTPHYMAPEQADADPGAQGIHTDVWGLGALLYTALVGRPPFEGPTPLTTLHLVLQAEVEPPRKVDPQVPQELETIALRCLQKQPHRRYRSAADVAADLGRFIDGVAIQARPVGVLERGSRWMRSNLALSGAIGALAVAGVALLGMGVALLRPHDQESATEAVFAASSEVSFAASAMAPPLAADELARKVKGLRDQAKEMGARGDNERVVEALSQALKLAPDDAELLLKRALAHQVLRNAQLALRDYAACEEHLAQEDIETRAMLYVNRAVQLQLIQRYDEALADLERLLELRPGEPKGLQIKARVLKGKGERQRAMTILHDLGSRLFDAGNLSLAEEIFAEALEMSPRSAELLIHRGRARQGNRKFKEAFEDYSAAVAARDEFEALPADRRAYLHLCRSTILGVWEDDEAALAEADRGLELVPGSPRLCWQRALVLLRLGRIDEARKQAEEGLDYFLKNENPSPSKIKAHAGLLFVRGRALQQLPAFQQREGAEKMLNMFRGAVRYDPDRNQYLAVFLVKLWSLGYMQDLNEHLGRLDPSRAVSLGALVACEGDQWFVSALLARLHLKAGKVQDAVEAYSRAIEADPGQVDLLLHRSRVREELGDNAGALEDLQRFLDLAPAEHPERDGVQRRLSKGR